jgi:hypothetical protein
MLTLSTGFGIGLGLSEAPSNASKGAVPLDATSVTSFWIGPSTQYGSAPSGFAEELAEDIDQAPTVSPGVYHCPDDLGQYAVILMFLYANGDRITANVAITGCDWVRVGPPTIPTDNPGRGHRGPRWVTKQLRADLVSLGAPPWARGSLTR